MAEKKEISFESGVYTGQVDEKDIPHGKGKYVYTDGNIYEGDWVDGKRHGKGKYTFVDGNVYEGDWVDDAIPEKVKGKITFADGEIYIGDLVDGQKHGNGESIYPNGEVYKGAFLNGQRHGKGISTYPGGDVYKGYYVDGQRNGQGVYTCANGEVYEGEFENDEMHTRTIRRKFGVYVGEVNAEGNPHGQGELKLSLGSNHNVYKGEFKDGVIRKGNTKVCFVCLEGDEFMAMVFYGDFNAKGQLHGKGMTICACDGDDFYDTYEGEFKNARRHGKGKSTRDGEMGSHIYEGDWVDDKRHGKGKYVITIKEGKLKSTESYEGDFRNDEKHGKGKLLFMSGEFYEGEFKNDEMHGKGIASQNGKLYKVKYKNGEILL